MADPEMPPDLCQSAKILFKNGVINVINGSGQVLIENMMGREEFNQSMDFIRDVIDDPYIKSFCKGESDSRSSEFVVYRKKAMENENEATRRCGQSINSMYKYDGHAHLGGSFPPWLLLKFIKEKLELDEIVFIDSQGELYTLKEVFQMENIDYNSLTTDSFGCQADLEMFRNFACFNKRFVIFRSQLITDILLSRDGYLKGRYFAELIKEELKNIAEFFVKYDLLQDTRLFLQIPRKSENLIENGNVRNFADILSNIFVPLGKACLHPAIYPNEARFLEHVVGFDSVDDESRSESNQFDEQCLSPGSFKNAKKPYPYVGWLYYIRANINVLNGIRLSSDMPVLVLSNHCMEAISPEHHGTASFLLSRSIIHARTLYENPTLEMLYYLAQIPIIMAVRSNIRLFQLDATTHPLEAAFNKGLTVTNSSDDCMLFGHHEPGIIGEYNFCQTLWGFSAMDTNELNFNSIKASEMSQEDLRDKIGMTNNAGVFTSDIVLSGLDNNRLTFRRQQLLTQLDKIYEKDDVSR